MISSREILQTVHKDQKKHCLTPYPLSPKTSPLLPLLPRTLPPLSLHLKPEVAKTAEFPLTLNFNPEVRRPTLQIWGKQMIFTDVSAGVVFVPRVISLICWIISVLQCSVLMESCARQMLNLQLRGLMSSWRTWTEERARKRKKVCIISNNFFSSKHTVYSI